MNSSNSSRNQTVRHPLTESLSMPLQTSISASAAQPAASSDDAAANDPWLLYGGNIAAACMATNESVASTRPEETDHDQDKQRQRASNRLTAWQSRERKRIEFEVMQERKAELTQKNEVLRKENEQIKNFIQRLRFANQMGNNSMAAASRLSAMQGSAQGSSMPRMDARMDGGGGRFFPFPSSQQRRDLPPLLGEGSQQHPGLFFQNIQNHNPSVHDRSIVTPTIFAPITRNSMQQSIHLPLNNFSGSSQPMTGFDVPYLRTTSQSSLKRQVGGDLGLPSESHKRTRREPQQR